MKRKSEEHTNKGAIETEECADSGKITSTTVNSNKRKASRSNKRKRRRKLPLSGMVFAVSTLDVKNVKNPASYQSIRDEVVSLGGSVSSQVHKRVVAVLCTETAARNCTQRIRKAIKKSIPVVSVKWLGACHNQHNTDATKDVPSFEDDKFSLLDCATDASRKQGHTVGSVFETAKGEMLDSVGENTEGANGTDETANNDNDESTCNTGQSGNEEQVDVEDLPGTGWTEPVSLGCCCVCHENGDVDCPWCVECRATNKELARATQEIKNRKELELLAIPNSNHVK